MERLLAQIGLTYLSVLAVVFYLDTKWKCFVAVLCVLLIVLFFAVKKYRKTIYLPAMAITALIACVLNISYTAFVYDKTVDKYDEFSGKITAVLIEEPNKIYDDYFYQFNCTSVNGEKADFDFVAYHNDLFNIDEFDEIETQVEFYKSNSKNNIANGYFLTADFGYDYPQLSVTTPQRKPLRYYAIAIRKCARQALKTNLSPEAFPVCSALLLGDKYAIPAEIQEQFVHIGASHLIVVSGMHFSILASAFLFFAQRRYGYRHYFLVSAAIFVFAYMGITGCSPSVLRSGIMLLVCILGLGIQRDPYSPNSLGLAGIIIPLFSTPYIAGDIGLILSFASTFSIVTLSPVIYDRFSKYFYKLQIKRKSKNSFVKTVVRYINKIPFVILSMLCVNVSAYIVSVPLSIFFFNSFSTMSVISSFVLYFPVEVLMIMSLIIVLLRLVPFLSFVVQILGYCTDFVSELTLDIVELFSRLPFSYINITYKFIYLCVAFSVVMFFVLFFSKNRHRITLFSVLFLLVFLSGFVSAQIFNDSVASLYIYDVSAGEAVMYCKNDTSAVLSMECNSASAYNATNEMKKTVSDIEFVSSISDTSNAQKSLVKLNEVFAIDTVLMYDTKRTVTLEKDVNVLSPKTTSHVELSDGSTIYYPTADEEYITYFKYGYKSLLILPKGIDVETVEEKYRKADTIVVSDCPDNYELLSCDTLVISEESDVSYYLMKNMHSISNRVLLTCEGDIKLLTEV